MANQISIVNRALASIGTRSTVSSMTEGSNESNAASLQYAPVRQQLIQSGPWGFSKATATLSLLKAQPGTPENASAAPAAWNGANAPPPGWAYSYAYPSDCLFARKVVPNINPANGASIPIFPVQSFTLNYWDAPGARFEIATDTDANNNQITVLLTSMSQAILCYTCDIQNETIWPANFQAAMVAALAGKLALTLTGDKALAKQKYDEANAIILEARRIDDNEGPTVVDHVPDWIATGHGARNLVPGWSGGGWSASWGPMFSL